jgi:hypothetical protein
VPLVEQEPCQSTWINPQFFVGFMLLGLYLSFMCMLCRSLFVLLSFFFWPLCCLFFYDIHVQILITSLVSVDHCVVCSSMIYMYRFWLPLWYLVAIVLFVLLWYTCTDSDYLFAICCPLCCLFFYDIHVQILITSLVSCGHYVVCSSLIYMYRFWLPLWYLLTIVLFVLLWYTCTDSDYLFGICWPLCCLFFYDIHVQILITSLVSVDHCVVCSSLIYMYRFWLPLWYPKFFLKH